MCGFVTIVALKGQRVPEESLLRASAAIAHRGPDDERSLTWENVKLGFRRLSIIDLAGGAQPLQNEDGTLALLCNGEIYNSPDLREGLIQRGHQFATHSDCEVILHLYEESSASVLEKIDGMFAGVLLDKARRTLL